ncbi:MAG: hypothetical protein J6Y79_01510 [Paludibacteraceae bacterium]|nr:hypothetical protein [Paludibacteraceae bacterium]
MFVFGAISFHVLVYLFVAGFFLLQTLTTLGERILLRNEHGGSTPVIIRTVSDSRKQQKKRCIPFSICGNFRSCRHDRTFHLLSLLLSTSSNNHPAPYIVCNTCKGFGKHLFNRPPPVL